MLSDEEKLELYLCPPGRGVFNPLKEKKLHKTILDAISFSKDLRRNEAIWKKQLREMEKTFVYLLACPSDSGAGILRGCNMGPLFIRQFLYANKGFRQLIEDKRLLDLGDIRVHPQLLEDAMLEKKQLQRVREALYPKHSQYHLKVSPLDILSDVLKIILKKQPRAKILLLGGDHGLSLPMVEAYARLHAKHFAVVHLDAHTDLLESRLGISRCFATWAYHANTLLKKKGSLIQVGLRNSSKSQSYWEKKLQVKQFWAPQILKKPKELKERILQHLHKMKVKNLYISQDIDATDPKYAPCCGTPEPGGLDPDFIVDLMDTLGREFSVVGSDLMEVAPYISHGKAKERESTLRCAERYLLTLLCYLVNDKVC